MEKLLENKIFKICSSIIEWIVIIVLIFLIILVGVQKFSNRGNFFGYRIYTIISGSMIPTYNVGDTVLIKEMTADNIEIGDAVTYLGEGGDLNGKIITHQVVDIEFDDHGKYLFHTKGIANNIEDPIVSQDQVLGKVIHKFFFLTMLGKLTTSMPLLFIFVVIPLAIIIAIEIIKLVYKSDEEIDKEVKEELEEIKEKKYEKEEKEEKEEVTKEIEKEEEILEEEIKKEVLDLEKEDSDEFFSKDENNEKEKIIEENKEKMSYNKNSNNKNSYNKNGNNKNGKASKKNKYYNKNKNK